MSAASDRFAGEDTDQGGGVDLESIESGGVKLATRVFQPGAPSAAAPERSRVAILLHGFPGIELNHDLAHVLRRAGYLVLQPHYRGSWGMPGNFSWSNCVDDALAVIETATSDAFRARQPRARGEAIVIGHSVGGFVALQAAARHARVSHVASLACLDFGAYVRTATARDANAVAETAKRWDTSHAPLAGTSGDALAREAFAKGEAWELARLAPRLRDRAVLLAAAAGDPLCPPEIHHAPLVARYRDGGVARLCEFTLEASHSFTSRRVELARRILAWLER